MRLRQGILALDAGFHPTPELPPEIATLLNDRQRAWWAELPVIERSHLARVGGILLEAGHTDPDLLTASVFHDIGKHSSRGGVRLPHRLLRVLLDLSAPWYIARLRASSGAIWPLHPLWLSVHHARLGAARAASLGCSARVCWLIAHHEDAPPVNDTDLAALQSADDLA